MSAGTHTEFVGSDWMACRCVLQQDHTREQYEALYAEDADPTGPSDGAGP